jgi:hypothetical protein
MKQLSKKEKKWIERCRILLMTMPKSLRVYVVDMNVVACKAGTPSTQVDETLLVVLDNGAMLGDIHDARNFGNDYK